jgi:hypothetical protein
MSRDSQHLNTSTHIAFRVSEGFNEANQTRLAEASTAEFAMNVRF